VRGLTQVPLHSRSGHGMIAQRVPFMVAELGADADPSRFTMPPWPGRNARLSASQRVDPPGAGTEARAECVIAEALNARGVRTARGGV
jgi:hypothetical protein